MDVWVLQYESYTGAFESEELAHKQIVKDALRGVTIRNVRLGCYPIVKQWTNPLDDALVVQSIWANKKIQAIKRHRETNPGMGLKEAKDIIEAVWDQALSLEDEEDLEEPF